MRILPFMPLSEGYDTPSIDLNEDEGILDIFHPAEGHLIKESHVTPEILILRCRLQGVARKPSEIRVQLTAETESLESALLYNESSISYGYDKEVLSSQWQGIALNYAGVGTAISEGESFAFQGIEFHGGRLILTSPLYVKPFRVEDHHIEEQQKTLESGSLLTTPSGTINKKVLRGYGGYFKEGVSLRDIQQIYYALTSTHNQTRMRLYSSDYLRKEGSPPPFESSDTVFVKPLEIENTLSLDEVLARGYACLKVESSTISASYKSFHCAALTGNSTLINVYFTPY
ncbi:MAG: hypothetical protein ACD_16C00103G0007 [uncultured bacterium]|nr:MAG: hypothetical protein ACD_16C00103G0007 [uncultured bacterium]OFW70201.1 MAG: hypothetical protein A2X70_00235 [Alphaproteobacteria bacterium GWC2_42_16]OFW73796.1 MAG: hypothetical protein A2Z80_05705 [Alphaproteobacteria bacterium GWA2_41_27]OFW84825.1 MAG: hypothetical protein A2W06_04460 [Alphaproteobacteria bacterium RBG_16_42_14]OFW84933.1 MAG: hypothetical protein A3E50_02005 [Alphaproteobacteria bacterium RIFCSPHIGHO2_12_FULL_42_100]OFW91219.1 MAG: hypothetical protein A3C41_061